MIVLRSDLFIEDVEQQFEWYAEKAGWDVAERYLNSVQAGCGLLAQYPLFGPCAGLNHPKLKNWRFFVVFRPFQKHLLFYQIHDGQLTMMRTMHGHRNLPQRLLQPPGG